MHLLFQNRRGTLPLKKLSTKVRSKKNGFGHFWIFKNVQKWFLLEKFGECVFFERPPYDGQVNF
jgi:hypothetical protein